MNNYIQINLGGKERGLKFNQLAWEEFIRSMPLNDENKFDWLNSNSIMAYSAVYGGLLGNAVVKREVVDFDFEKVTEWVDAANTDDIKKAIEMFKQSQQYNEMLEKMRDKIRSVVDTGDKKKAAKARPKKS